VAFPAPLLRTHQGHLGGKRTLLGSLDAISKFLYKRASRKLDEYVLRMRSAFQSSPKWGRTSDHGACFLACYTEKRCPEAPLPCTASVTYHHQSPPDASSPAVASSSIT
jgi:hypothetical protein